MDEQTLHGKGPIGIARRAHAAGVPTVALVGGLEIDDALLHEAGFWAALPITTAPMPLETALAHADALVERGGAAFGLSAAIESGVPLGSQNITKSSGRGATCSARLSVPA